MYPPLWGPELWNTLHLMAFTYPIKPDAPRQEHMRQFLKNVCPNLPCPGCGLHCKIYMDRTPPALQSRDALKKWMCDFHNEVNKRTGKRELTYEEADQVLKEKYFDREKGVEMQRAQHMRREDHRHIEKWKKMASSSSSDYQL